MTLRFPSIRWVLLAGGLGTVAIVAALAVSDNTDRAAAPPSVLAGPFPNVAAPAEVPSLQPGAITLPTPPATPDEAATAFFSAEARDDFDNSYSLLAADDRSGHGNSLEWAAAHDELPAVVAFTPDGPARFDGERAVVNGRLEFVPIVDEVVGIVPATANAQVLLVAEDGGWRVDYSRSIVVPEFPEPSDAVAVAVAWVADRQGCGVSRGGYEGNLLGEPRIEQALCTTSGTFAPGRPGTVDDLPDPAPFLSTFGPDGVAALVSVPFDGPAPLTIVAAPFGDTWVVVGAE